MPVMKDTTPYRDRPATEVAREQACMRTVFRAVDTQVTHVWEAFAGLGVTAEVLRERFPSAEILAADLDQECVHIYNGKGYGLAIQQDCCEHFEHTIARWRPRSWGASLDYNKFTLLDLRGERGKTNWKVDLLGQVFELEPQFVQVTDSACRYLHLNWQRYRLEANDPSLYAQALGREVQERWGYRLKVWDKHHAASYLMFVRSE